MEKPYSEDCAIVKQNWIGHIQKRMGSALLRLVVEYKGQFISNSKRIIGTSMLTIKVIDKLQTYYGLVIPSNFGDLHGIMKAVQATLHHMTSMDDREGHQNSWCWYNKVKGRNELDVCNHGFDAIAHAIVQLLKPISNWLGCRLLLSNCLPGHPQNANESLRSKLEILSQTAVFF